uniref:Uncharacterized protein n=1 Tax=Desertifilum tharense IPPAS B-1220 TaxID=1781255 RepID=A0ACD5GYX5_9CYAN
MGMGEEEMGKLANYQLSTHEPTRNTATWCASYGTRNVALFSPIPPTSYLLSTQHFLLSTKCSHRFLLGLL